VSDQNESVLRIATYLDLHGWETIRDPRFHEWLREEGVDVETLALWPQERQLSLGLYEDGIDA
jgi:hypothetical protein